MSELLSENKQNNDEFKIIDMKPIEEIEKQQKQIQTLDLLTPEQPNTDELNTDEPDPYEIKEGTVGLEDTLTDEELKKAYELTKQALEEIDAYNIDTNLDEDYLKVPGQNYAVIQYIGPSFKAKTEIFGFRIMGLFDTIEDASDHIVNIVSVDDTFDTGIVECYKYIASYPIVGETQDDLDKFLNDIVFNHKEEKELSRIKFEMRQEKLKQNQGRYVEKQRDLNNENSDESEHRVPEGPLNKIKQNSNQNQQVDPKQKTYQNMQSKLLKKLEQRKQKNILRKNLDLSESEIKVPDQKFVAISFVGASGNNSRVAMKIKGAFGTYEECQQQVKQMMDMDDTFDIFVAQMYTWLPCDPDLNKIEQIYGQEELNQMFKETKEQQKKTFEYHKERSRFSARKDIQKEVRSTNELKQVIEEAQFDEDEVKNIMKQIQSDPFLDRKKENNDTSADTEIELLETEDYNQPSDIQNQVKIPISE